MKIKINKKLKIAIILFLAILIASNLYLQYKELKVKKFKEQRSQAYNYSNKNLINYEVFLKPNKLYEKGYLEEGKLYIMEFVDYIKANLNYEFKGERNAEITGNYEVLAKVKGHIGEGEKQINIWEKDFPIIDNRSFKEEDNTLSINEKVNIELDYYNVFAKEIIESSKINCQTTLNIIMNVNLKGVTDKGNFEEKLTSDLIIPLNVSMFEIGGNNNVEKQGAIEETIQIQLPVNKNKIILFGVIIGVLSLALIYLIFFTVQATPKNPLEKEINKIFRKHGDRLVALNNDIETGDLDIIYVKTIDDLVRIADEIGKPILYKYNQDYKDINKFYVSDEEQIYLLDLTDMLIKDEGDKIVDEEIKIES